MNFSVLWKPLIAFQPKVPQKVEVDLKSTVPYNLGGVHKLQSANSRSVYPRLEVSRTRSFLYQKRTLTIHSRRSSPKEPRARWSKFPGTPEKRHYSATQVTDLEANEDITVLEPPIKKIKMDSVPMQKGDTFKGDTFKGDKDVEILEVVQKQPPKFRDYLPTAFAKSIARKFKCRRSTVMSEEEQEDKKKYGELLIREVYCNVNRQKRLGTTESSAKLTSHSIGFALKTMQSQSPKKVPEVIDLEGNGDHCSSRVGPSRVLFDHRNSVTPETQGMKDVPSRVHVDRPNSVTLETQGMKVVPRRVLVDRRNSITPVTQATENPNEVEKTKPKESVFEKLIMNKQKPFMNPNYAQSTKESHLKSIQLRTEQVQAEIKMSKKCNEINRAAKKEKHEKRLEGLHEDLKKYLTLTECFPKDEEVEVIPPLPKLTEQMEREIDVAFGGGSQNAVLADAFNLKIQRRDILTLRGLSWLNDEVINFYMNLLMARGKKDNYPSVYAFNTFFYPKLVSGGHSVLKRWTKKVDIFAHDFVLVPVHLGVHWCMAIIDMVNKSVMYFDSMGGPNEQCLSALERYLCDERMDKKKEKLDTSEWQFIRMKDIPQQENGSDCGMFSCMYAEYTCRRAAITFTQTDMPFFRRKMVYEIIKVNLLC